MENKENKIYVLTKTQLKEVIAQVDILKQIYLEIQNNKQFNAFQKSILLKNQIKNAEVNAEIKDILKKS